MQKYHREVEDTFFVYKLAKIEKKKQARLYVVFHRAKGREHVSKYQA